MAHEHNGLKNYKSKLSKSIWLLIFSNTNFTGKGNECRGSVIWSPNISFEVAFWFIKEKYARIFVPKSPPPVK